MLLAPTPRIAAPAPGFAPIGAEPPARWSRWWTSPIARFDYAAGSRMPLFAEARIPAERGLTGARRPAVTWGGTSIDEAVAAARLLAASPVDVEFSFRNGRTRATQVHAAYALLRDSANGAFWIAPLQTTVRHGDEWVDAPHAVDGPAFEGPDAVLGTPVVRTATRDLVAIVGRAAVVKPVRWTDAPPDSRIDA